MEVEGMMTSFGNPRKFNTEALRSEAFYGGSDLGLRHPRHFSLLYPGIIL